MFFLLVFFVALINFFLNRSILFYFIALISFPEICPMFVFIWSPLLTSPKICSMFFFLNVFLPPSIIRFWIFFWSKTDKLNNVALLCRKITIKTGVDSVLKLSIINHSDTTAAFQYRANAMPWPNVAITLIHRLRCWHNIISPLGRCFPVYADRDNATSNHVARTR